MAIPHQAFAGCSYDNDKKSCCDPKDNKQQSTQVAIGGKGGSGGAAGAGGEGGSGGANIVKTTTSSSGSVDQKANGGDANGGHGGNANGGNAIT